MLVSDNPKFPPHPDRHHKHQRREKCRAKAILAEIVDDESLDAEKIKGHEETDDRGGENGNHDFIFSHFMRRMI